MLQKSAFGIGRDTALGVAGHLFELFPGQLFRFDLGNVFVVFQAFVDVFVGTDFAFPLRAPVFLLLFRFQLLLP